jgi:hypothetical protein
LQVRLLPPVFDGREGWWDGTAAMTKSDGFG